MIKRGVEDGEEPSHSVVDLWDSVKASDDMKDVPVKGEICIPEDKSDNVQEVRPVTSEEVKQEARQNSVSLSKQQLHVPLARHKQKTAAVQQPEGDEAKGANAAGGDSGSESEDNVEKIVDHNVYDIDQGLWEYRVQWSGYTSEAA